MNITIRAQHFELSDPIRSFVHDKLESALSRFGDDVLSVDVFCTDVNGPKGGPDKRVVLRIQLRRRHQVTVESLHHDLYIAISKCSGKARRVVRRKIRKFRKVQKLSLRDMDPKPSQQGV
mgnify:FL=1